VTEIVVATHNAGKTREIAAVMSGLPVRFSSLAEYVEAPQIEEHGATFEENARIKALEYAAALRLPCLADDSGLEVDALDGAPGVRSARYAGKQGDDTANNRLLRRQLDTVADNERGARFVCVAALAFPDGRMDTTRGECSGIILREERGSGGFGYDPLFLPDGYTETFAEMEPETKNRISHRAVAMRLMRRHIELRMGAGTGQTRARRIEVDFSAPQPHHIGEAAQCIRAGEVVALRTDTLYGLMADATCSKTVRKVYELKRRAAGNPLSVLVADMAMAEEVAVIEAGTREAIGALWPGPVTIVLTARRNLTTEVLGAQRSVAVRIPSAALPRDVIIEAGVPVTGTSANRSGQPGAQTADEVIAALGDSVALVLDSGPVGATVASTLIDLRRWPPVILREGAVAADRIEQVLGCRVEVRGPMADAPG